MFNNVMRGGVGPGIFIAKKECQNNIYHLQALVYTLCGANAWPAPYTSFRNKALSAHQSLK